jgi:demethylmenaquinone methyltransferase/2-methoxy-6-polyprenyl-1,4-benzoquinol methylase
MDHTKTSQPSRQNVSEMFDRIAPRYDLLNRLLSLRRDVAWRRRVARHLPPGDALELLDLATGTGDQILHLLDRSRNVKRAVGLDLAARMLDIGRAKVKDRNLQGVVTLMAGDAMRIPFPERSFDVITMSFGIRNVVSVPEALREMHRVLRPGGRLLILEFSIPDAQLLRRMYLFYLRNILPRLGAWISGDGSAYRYLNVTIEGFPRGETFCSLLRDAGFGRVAAFPLSFGVSTIYRGDA